jgi:DNA modification methylase
MPDGCVDAVVTDPPYGLEFMGKDWDAPWKTDRRQVFDGTLTDVRPNPFGRSKVRYGTGASYGADVEPMQAFQLWAKVIFSECLRVLKPGGHLLSFGGSRTYHRMACAVEDAGFEIRDQIMWIYGSGFPKSHNGEWGGTALKPAHEPIVVARKPLVGTVEANWREHGTGALNIDKCRVETTENLNGGAYAKNAIGRDQMWGADAGNSWVRGGAGEFIQPPGRWPANLIHDGSDEVMAAFPDSNGSGQARTLKRGQRAAGGFGMADEPGQLRNAGTGSSARFFYCAKASKADRGEGNAHPTVKPTDLMRYLCRLVTPPGGVVLDPFMGSGSTGKAAMLEGLRFIGCEREAEYLEIARARISHACTSMTQPAPATDPRTDLFA